MKTIKANDLWVTMNDNVKFTEHWRIVASKGNQVLGMIQIKIIYKKYGLVTFICRKSVKHVYA